jgi:hypothetical protein
MGKARFIPIIVTIIVVIGFLVVVTRPSGNEYQTPPPMFPAPKGTPVRIDAEALYVDDSGGVITTADLTPVRVSGVEITVVDEKGDSQSLTTTEGSPTSFEMLSGHGYTIQATFRGSTSSTQATTKSYSDHDIPPYGGSITVYVGKGSEIIESVAYQEPMFL